MGGMNFHIEILFEDGVRWMARSRRSNATSPPLELRNYIMLSEIATLKFLSERTTVPAPKVFHFNLDETNSVGVGYILMEKMPGRSFHVSDRITTEQKRKVIGQLADVYIELQAHPFGMMGSLNLPGSNDIGPFAQESLADYQDSMLKKHGPFASPNEYFEMYINFILDLITRQEAYTNHPVDAFLIHRYLLESIPSIFPNNGLDDGKFYLKHANDKGDEILVDEDFNITGIVDWEWAHTAPKSMAFKSPLALLPVGLFYDGDNSVGGDEFDFAAFFEDKGRRDLGDIVRNGRLLHQLEFCCGYDLFDWNSYPGIFMGLVRALSNDGKSNGLGWETWRAEALERYRSDHRLQSIFRLQKC